ncbi:MAG: protein kinase [Myxococcales bacterium]|nr:protein kinase [Myxococcales bacterium]
MSTAPSKRQPIPFGKYLLLDRINIGGMAEVWRGKTFGAGGFERLVAIKRILPNIAEDEEFISMFLDEAKITVQLAHANIAQVYDLNHIGTNYYIAMEYISGKDMRAIFDRCRKKGEPAPVPLTCYVLSKVCEGLDYAHRKKDNMGRDMNIVHRDVSPQNALISYEGEVKVIDFGIAKAAGKATKTQAGILKGKFGYMSPEQIRGLPLDRRSDVFSVGICLYEMLTGERLFVGDSDFSVLEKVRKAEVLPPSTYNRRVPEPLEKIVLKALAKDVDERYQYANEVADDLQRFLITSDSIFSRKDLMQYMKSTFAEDVEREKLRIQEYADIKPPEGMLAAAEMGFGVGAVPLPPPSSAGASELTVQPQTATAAAPQATVASPTMAVPQAKGRPPPLLQPSVKGPPVLSPATSQETKVPGANGPRRPASVPMVAPVSAAKLTAAAPMLSNVAGIDEDEDAATILADGRDYFNDPAEAEKVLGPKAGASRPKLGEPPPTNPDQAAPTLPPGRSGEGQRVSRSVAPTRQEVSTSPGERIAERTASEGPWSKPVVAAFAAGGALLVCLLGVLGWLLLREPASGLLLLEVPQELRGKARINVNGDEVKDSAGKPPAQFPILRKVKAGKAVILVTADGYEAFTAAVVVKGGEEVTPVKAVLKPSVQSVQLIVVTQPELAEVRVDDELVKPLGTPGMYVGEMAAGVEHRIEVKLPGFRPFKKTLSAKETSAPAKVTATLDPYEYAVKVTSEPSRATVVVNGKALGETPEDVTILGGVSELLLRKKCYETTRVPVPLPPEPKGVITVSGSLRRLQNCY